MKVSLPGAVCALLLVSVATRPAVVRAREPQQPVALGATTTVVRPGEVIGMAWRRDNTPIPHALLQLRSVTSARVVMTTEADQTGQFSFTPVPADTYAVELVDRRRQVLAIGQTFTISPGNSVSTLVRLGTEGKWFAGLFTNAAAAALATAATLGLTVVGQGSQPASPRQ